MRKRNHRAKTVKADEIKTQNLKRWEEDYQLQDGGRLALFQEYLEMGMYARSPEICTRTLLISIVIHVSPWRALFL